MANVQTIENARQKGRAAVARVLGQNYSVYRLTSASNNSITAGTPLYTNFKSVMTSWRSRMDIENSIFELQSFNADCDSRGLQIGDIFVENGFRSDGSMYAVASIRPLKATVLMRVEQPTLITLYNPAAGRADQQPVSGAVQIKAAPGGGYGGGTKASEQILTLTAGNYAFSTTGTPATVPCGLQPLNRLHGAPPSKLPTDPRRQLWLVYCPILPGAQLVESCYFGMGNGDRYDIELYFLAQFGLQGYICIVEKAAV